MAPRWSRWGRPPCALPTPGLQQPHTASHHLTGPLKRQQFEKLGFEPGVVCGAIKQRAGVSGVEVVYH